MGLGMSGMNTQMPDGTLGMAPGMPPGMAPGMPPGMTPGMPMMPPYHFLAMQQQLMQHELQKQARARPWEQSMPDNQDLDRKRPKLEEGANSMLQLTAAAELAHAPPAAETTPATAAEPASEPQGSPRESAGGPLGPGDSQRASPPALALLALSADKSDRSEPGAAVGERAISAETQAQVQSTRWGAVFKHRDGYARRPSGHDDTRSWHGEDTRATVSAAPSAGAPAPAE